MKQFTDWRTGNLFSGTPQYRSLYTIVLLRIDPYILVYRSLWNCGRTLSRAEQLPLWCSSVAYIGISTGIKNTIKVRNKYDRKIRNQHFCIFSVFILYCLRISYYFRILDSYFLVFISYFLLFGDFRAKPGLEHVKHMCSYTAFFFKHNQGVPQISLWIPLLFL